MKKLLIVCILFLLASCKANLTTGYRTLIAIAHARDTTSKALAQICGDIRDGCKAKHALKTDEYKTCLGKCPKVLEDWAKYILPAIDSALIAAYAVLETAYQKNEKNADWITVLKPGVCALVGALKQWKDVIPSESFSTILGYIDAPTMALCGGV